MAQPDEKSRKVTFGEWFLLAISLFFTLLALLLLRTDFRESMVMLAMFGSALAVNVHIIRRKFRLKKLSSVSVKVVGGIRIRPSLTRLLQLGIGFLVVGVIFVLYGKQNDWLLQGIAWLIASVGGAILLGVLTHLLPAEFIQFEPDGFVMGRRGVNALIPWDAITRISAGELHSNQAVFLWVDEAAVQAIPPSCLPKVHKGIASARDWIGADFVVMSSIYSIDAPILLATLERYASGPQARTELNAQRALP